MSYHICTTAVVLIMAAITTADEEVHVHVTGTREPGSAHHAKKVGIIIAANLFQMMWDYSRESS